MPIISVRSQLRLPLAHLGALGYIAYKSIVFEG